MEKKKLSMPAVVLILGLATLLLAAVIYYFPRQENQAKEQNQIEQKVEVKQSENATESVTTQIISNSPTPEMTTTPEMQITEEPKEYYTLGDTILFDNLEITFLDVSVQKVDNRFADFPNAVIVNVTVKNLSSEIHGINMFSYDIYGSKGTQVDNASAYFDNSIDWAGDMRSGATLEGCFAMEYDGDGEYYLVFDDYSEDIEVKIDVRK